MEYILTAIENEKVIARISAYSLESLEEQLHKIEDNIQEYKAKLEFDKTHSVCCGAPLSADGYFCTDCEKHI